MSNILDDFNDHSPEPIPDQELLLSIWTEPRRTLRQLVQFQTGKYVDILFILGGMANGVDRILFDENLASDSSLLVYLAIAVAVGGTLGWVLYYLFAYLLQLAGNWLDGNGTTMQLRTILAWSLVPAIAFMILSLLSALLAGRAMFNEIDLFAGDFVGSPVILLLAIVQVITSIWSLVILVIGISVVQSFSIWRSIGNLLLAGLVFMLPIIIFAFLITLVVSGGFS